MPAEPNITAPGHTLLSRGIAFCRYPPFLQRNLNLALACIENSIRDAKQPRLSRAAWKPPTTGMVQAINAREGQKQKLRIDISSLAPNRKRAINSIDDHEPAGSTRKRCKVLEVECFVDISIWTSPDGIGVGDCVVKRKEECKLTGRKYQDDEVHFDVSLRKQVILSVGELEIPINSNGRWKQGLGKHYHIVLALGFANYADANLILPLMGVNGIDPGEPVTLTASWTNLPKCPKVGTAIPIQVKTSYSKQFLPQDTLKYGFEVNMAWLNVPVESTLETYNRFQRQAADISQKPPDPRIQPTRMESWTLEYWHQDKFRKFEGLQCLVCQRKNFTTPASLRYHLHSWHQASIRMSQKSKLVQITLMEASTPSSKLKRDRTWSDIEWVAPSPSELRSHYHAENELHKKMFPAQFPTPDLRKKNTTIPSPKPNLKSRKGEPKIQPQRKSPGEVQLRLDKSRKKKFRRPASPAQSGSSKRYRYYTTVSKRTIEKDERLSESDDDVDVDFQHLAAAAVLKTFYEEQGKILPASAGKFVVAWNRHFREEDLLADLFTGDAILRFMEKEQGLLRDADCWDYMRTRLEELLDADVITPAIYRACVRRLGPDPKSEPKPKTKPKSDPIKSIPKDQGDSSRKPRQHGDCSCGASFTFAESSEWAHCNNQVCAS
jgi:hypothetical protein